MNINSIKNELRGFGNYLVRFKDFLVRGFNESVVMKLAIYSSLAVIAAVVARYVFGFEMLYHLFLLAFDVTFIAGTIVQWKGYGGETEDKYKVFWDLGVFNYALIFVFILATAGNAINLARHLTVWFVENYGVPEDAIIGML